MKICNVAGTPEFKALEKEVGFFNAVKDWAENNFTVRTPEEVRNTMAARDFEEDMVLASPVNNQLDYLLFSANKDVYKHFNLISKDGNLKVVPYKTNDQVARINSWLKTLNKSPYYTFRIITGVKGKKHIGIFAGKTAPDPVFEEKPRASELSVKYFNGGQTNSLSDIMTKIAESDSPLNQMAKYLLTYSKINDVAVHMSKVDMFTHVGDTPAKGFYRPDKNYIAVAEYDYKSKTYPYPFETLLIHEALHALSYKALRRSGEFTEAFKKIYEESLSQLGKYTNDLSLYGNYNMDEFFVALFTNSKFIKKLKTVPPISTKEFKNLFQEIMDYILGLLGIEKSDSLYEQAFSVASNILNSESEFVERSKDYTESNEDINPEDFEDSDLNDDVVSQFLPLGNTLPQYNVLLAPIELDAESAKLTAGREIASKLMNRLAANLGISASVISEADAISIYKAKGKNYTGEKGFFTNGQVYLVAERMTTETVFHEFAHPIIRSISETNPTLFNQLYNNLLSTDEGKAIKARVANLYADDLTEGDMLFKEEVLVTALGKKADNILRGLGETSKFSSFIKELLYAIKQFFRKNVFPGKKIKIESLNVDTTLDELAQLLNNDEFQMETRSFTNSDVISASKEYREEILEQLKGLESPDLKKLTDRLYSSAKNVSKYLGKYNYKELRELLKDPMDRSDVKEILSNIELFAQDTGIEFETPEEGLKYMTTHASNLLNSLYRLESVAKKMLQHYAELSKNPDIKDNLSKLYYYNNVIKEWAIFLDQAKEVLLNDVYEQKIDINNPLINLIDSITNIFQKTKVHSERMLEGVNTILYDELENMSENIDEHYKNLIEFYEKKGAPAKTINRYKYEWEQVKLSPEKIKALIKGELGDAHPLNFFLEGYMNNQDPVVFGFAKYVKNHYIEMNGVIQEQMTNFMDGIEPLLKKAGYNTANARLHEMFRDLTVSARKRKDKDGNDVSYYEFLNPFNGEFEYERSTLRQKIADAKKKHDETNTDESKKELDEAEANLELFEVTYMQQENTPEFYKRFDLFKDDIGKKAYVKIKQKLAEIQGIQTNIRSIEEHLEQSDELDMLWREYKLLSSLTYPDSTPKQGEELEIAKRIAEYKRQTRELYESKPRKGLFENKYLAYIQSLIDSGIKKNSKEYKRKRQEWIDKNTVVRYTQEFYDMTGQIFASMAELSASDPVQKKLTDLFEKRNNILSSFKDENGHVSGMSMTSDQLDKILKIDEEIQDILDNSSSYLKISTGDWNAFVFYESKIDEFKASGQPDPIGRFGLTVDQWKDYTRIKKEITKSGKTRDEVEATMKKAKLLKDLKNLQSKAVTDDYIDKVNELMNEESRKYMKDRINTTVFTRSDIKYAANEKFLQEIFKVNPEFEEWFNDNHITKTFTTRSGEEKTYYTPSSAWTYREPNDTKYYEATVIKDEDGNEIDTIYAVPKMMYFYRSVKPQYKTQKLTMLDCIKQGIGIENATIDMQGRWLPKFSTTDNKYINKAFFDLKKSNPDKFNLLMYLIEKHLTYQNDYVSVGDRLNLEIPRYEIDNLETIQNVSAKESGNLLTRWAKQVKGLFTSTPDDFENGLGYKQQITLNKLDLFDEEQSRVPITGTYDIEQKLVSHDIQRSMMRYMMSGVKQKTLTDMLPIAKAVQALVNDPDNNPDKVVDGVKKFSKQKLLTNILFHSNTPKGSSIRAQAINAFIEREFEGQTEAGYTKDLKVGNVSINKIVNKLFGWSAWSYFGFNIPSALKNSYGMRFQSMIEAAGGGAFNYSDYMKGSLWASKVTMEFATKSFGGKKSLNMQLVDLMDPVQERFEKEIKRGTGINRSVASDIANLEFATSVRRMTELNAGLSIFGAMLKNTMIDRKMPDGTTQKIGYDQAWEVVDGLIKLKSGIDPVWDKNGKKFKSFVSKVHGVMNNLNGAYAQFEQPNGSRYLLFRWVTFLKNYFTRQFMSRFQFKWDKEKKIFMPRYDANMEMMTKGSYVEFISWLGHTIKNLGANVPYTNPQQLAAIKKVLAECLYLFLIFGVIVPFLFGYDDDDEDRYEKLRRKSGPLPIFFAEGKYDFNLKGWLSNHILNLAVQVGNENQSWLPVPGMGLDDYNSMLVLEGTALKSTISSYVKILDSLLDLATGDPGAYYKRAVGPYPWQQEGGAKIISTLARMLGVTGKVTDPTVALKAAETLEEFKTNK